MLAGTVLPLSTADRQQPGHTDSCTHTAVSTQAKYISQCIDEIKQELKQDNIAVKANAVCKLTYVSASSVASPACLSILRPSDIAAVRSSRFMQSPA